MSFPFALLRFVLDVINLILYLYIMLLCSIVQGVS